MSYCGRLIKELTLFAIPEMLYFMHRRVVGRSIHFWRPDEFKSKDGGY